MPDQKPHRRFPTPWRAQKITGAYVVRDANGLALADFRLAFFLVGMIAIAASALFLRLDADAGAEVSGHRPKRL